MAKHPTTRPLRSSDPPNAGEALYAFLEREWAALDVTRGAWCRQADLPDSTVYRWKSGHTPDINSLRIVARTLRRPMIEVLLAAGVVPPEEVDGREVVERPERPPATLEQALKEDELFVQHPGLDDVVRGVVTDTLALLNSRTRHPARAGKATVRRRR